MSLKRPLSHRRINHFYSHWGINFRGFFRALSGILLGKKLGGGSSITQQLARNLFLTPKFTISRKIKEMLLAIQIEKRYTKDQILTFYCNKIFFGGSIYGVGAAARYYFGKSIREINLAEAALLAGIIPGPNNIYNVFKRPENAINRRNFVLTRMREMKFIKANEYQNALKAKLPEKPFDINKDSVGDYFTEETRKYLEGKYGENLLYKGGLKVFTTLNGYLQAWAEEALRQGLRDLDKRRGWRSEDRLFNLLENKQDPKTHILPSWENEKIEVGRVLEGIVTEVGAKRAYTRITDYQGELTPENAQWTKKTLPKLLKKVMWHYLKYWPLIRTKKN